MSSANESMTTVEQAFSQHHQEIRRRAETAHNDDGQGALAFTKVKDAEDFDFRSESQSYVLYSLSHQGFAPIAEDETQPGVRIYGTFETVEDATEHAKIVNELDSKCSLMIGETHAWIVAAPNATEYNDSIARALTIDRIVQSHLDRRDAEKKEVAENVRKQQQGRTNEKTNDDDDDDNRPKRRSGRTHRMPIGGEIRGQKLAAVAFLPDTEMIPPRFLFKVFMCVENEALADAYVRNCAGDQVTDYDIDIVNTCEWIFPQNYNIATAPKTIYRDEELDKIMTSRKKQPKEVKRYKDWKESGKSAAAFDPSKPAVTATWTEGEADQVSLPSAASASTSTIEDDATHAPCGTPVETEKSDGGDTLPVT